MSQLPYLHSPDLTSYEADEKIFSPSLNGPLLLDTSDGEQDRGIAVSNMKSANASHRNVNLSNRVMKKMQTTVAIREQDPHRFKVLPLRQIRGSMEPTSVARGSSGESIHRDWAAVLRRKRNMSAGSTPFSSSRRGYPTSVSRFDGQDTIKKIDEDLKYSYSTHSSRINSGVSQNRDQGRQSEHRRDSSRSSIVGEHLVRKIRDSLVLPSGGASHFRDQSDHYQEATEHIQPLPTLSTLNCIDAPQDKYPVIRSESRRKDSPRDFQSQELHPSEWISRRRSQTVTGTASSRRRVTMTESGSTQGMNVKRHPTIIRHAIYAHSGSQFAYSHVQEEDRKDSRERIVVSTRHTAFVFPTSASKAQVTSDRNENRSPAATGFSSHVGTAVAKTSNISKPVPIARSRLVLADLDLNTLPVADPPAPYRPTYRRVPLAPWPPLDVTKRSTRDSLDAVVRAGLVAATGLPQLHEKLQYGHHRIVRDLLRQVDGAIAAWNTGMSYL